MKKIFIILIISHNLSSEPAEAPVPIYFNQKAISDIVYKNSLDLDMKSNEGWIRVIKSKERLFEYGIIITLEEQIMLLEYFKKQIEEKS